MTLKKRALSAVFWTFLQKFGKQGVGFVVSIFLARLLLPEEFGLIAMIAVFVSIGASLMQSGLGSSLIRSENLTQTDYSTVFFFNLAGSVVIYLIIFLLAPFIADFYEQEILTKIIRVYTLSFVINAFAFVQNTRLTKLLDFKTLFIVSFPSLIVGGGIGVLLAYNGFGVWSLVWYPLIQASLNAILLWYKSKWRPIWVFDKQKFFHHFNFGYKLTLSGILNSIFDNIYAIIIGKFYPAAQVGFFQRADSLKQLPVSNVSAAIGKVSFPLFAEIQNDDEKLRTVYKKIMQMVIFITTPILIIMAVLAEPLFRFLFTEKWLPAVPYFQILIANGILYPIHGFNLNILNVKGRSDLFLKLEVIKKVGYLIILIISFQFGIFGLLYGSVVFSLTAFFVNTYYTGKFINYNAWKQLKDILPILAVSILMGICIYFTSLIIEKYDVMDFWYLTIGTIIGVTTYFILSYLFRISSLHEFLKIVKLK